MATVADIMERDPIAVGRDDDVESVIRVLREHELPGVPVVNEGGRCVGIITENDLILRDEQADLHLPHHLELMGGVDLPGVDEALRGADRKAFASTAEDMMTPDPITIDARRARCEEAAKLIAKHKHNRLPVVEHGRLVGVVTRVDVLDALTAD